MYSTSCGFLVCEFYCSGLCKKIFQTPENGSSAQEILGNAASSIFLLFCGHVLGVLLSKRHSSLAWRGLEDITLPPTPPPPPPTCQGNISQPRFISKKLPLASSDSLSLIYISNSHMASRTLHFYFTEG